MPGILDPGGLPGRSDDSVQKLFGVYHELNNTSKPSKPGKPGDLDLSNKRKRPGDPRKDDEQENGDNRPDTKHMKNGDSEAHKKKKKRFTWSDELHRQFMGAIFDIGLKLAKPKLIHDSMNNAPPELTTEHIKSHLQKYRMNSKKSRDVFLEQFDISKRNADMNNDGKALNPSFHAYPLPVGDFPLRRDSPSKGSTLSRASSENSSLSDGGKRPGSYRESTRESARQYGRSHQHHHHFSHSMPEYCRSCAGCSCGASTAPPPPHHHQELLEAERRKMQLELERMNMQMELHKEIDQQHAFQQSKHLALRESEAGHSSASGDAGAPSAGGSMNARPHSSSFADFLSNSPYLSGLEGARVTASPLSLDDAIGASSANDTVFTEDDLFDFLH